MGADTRKHKQGSRYVRRKERKPARERLLLVMAEKSTHSVC